jgi:hypothetical protein
LRDKVEPSELDGVETDRRSSAGTASSANDGVTLGEGDSGRGDDTSCAACCVETIDSSNPPAIIASVVVVAARDESWSVVFDVIDLSVRRG